MAKSVKALINPKMLEWARTEAGYSLSDAAKKLGFEEARLDDLERGKELPSFAKLLDMADLYKRPVSLFYLKDPPQGWQPNSRFPSAAGCRAHILSPADLCRSSGAGAARSRACGTARAQRAGQAVCAPCNAEF